MWRAETPVKCSTALASSRTLWSLSGHPSSDIVHNGSDMEGWHLRKDAAHWLQRAGVVITIITRMVT
jgi:hypothetical protein